MLYIVTYTIGMSAVGLMVLPKWLHSGLQSLLNSGQTSGPAAVAPFCLQTEIGGRKNSSNTDRQAGREAGREETKISRAVVLCLPQ